MILASLYKYGTLNRPQNDIGISSGPLNTHMCLFECIMQAEMLPFVSEAMASHEWACRGYQRGPFLHSLLRRGNMCFVRTFRGSVRFCKHTSPSRDLGQFTGSPVGETATERLHVPVLSPCCKSNRGMGTKLTSR